MPSDIVERHVLSSGRRAWIQRVKIPGSRKPTWSVVISGEGFDGPEIFDVPGKNQAYAKLADILKADVMEVEP